WFIGLSLAIGAAWVSSACAQSQASRPWQRTDKLATTARASMITDAPVPLEEMPSANRAKVRAVLDHPSLTSRGQPETFTGDPTLYKWFLDHPDRAAVAWKRLGAKVADITNRGNGVFGWCDAQGSDVRWEAVYRGPRMHVWHAEGKVRPGSLLPLVPIQAVVVLRYTESRDGDGQLLIRHQAELVLHTDIRAVSLAARLFGASAPRLAEQYVSQVEMFFSALAWYVDQHPEKAEKLLRQ